MEFCSLFSGSSGNSLFIKHRDTRILCDAGKNGKQVERALHEIDEDASKLNAIILTHEHIDHIAAAGVLSRRYGIPLYANLGTWQALYQKQKIGAIKPEKEWTFETGRSFSIGDINITSFSTSHDAASPVGFTIDDGHNRMGIATDTGVITPGMQEQLSGCKLVVLESNHELEMLRNGPYPLRLKQRIAGSKGHLSNDMAGKFATDLIDKGTEHLILAHLSRENNLPFVAMKTTSEILKENSIKVGKDVELEVALRDAVSELYKI